MDEGGHMGVYAHLRMHVHLTRAAYSVPAKRRHVESRPRVRSSNFKKAKDPNFYETFAGFKCWQQTCFYLHIQVANKIHL